MWGGEEKNSSCFDQIGPNEIKMPINPALIAARRRPQKNTETCTCGGEEVAGGEDWGGEGAGLSRLPTSRPHGER